MLKKVELIQIYSVAYCQDAWQVTKTYQDDSQKVEVKDPYDSFEITDALGWLSTHGYTYNHTRFGWVAYPARMPDITLLEATR